MYHMTTFIVILCTFVLYVVMCVGSLCSNKANYARLEKSARKALRMTFNGLIVLGLAFCALSHFEIISSIGYKIFPKHIIDEIRDLMRAFLRTGSVYQAIEIMIAMELLVVEFCLVFSCVGLLVTKVLLPLQQLLCTRLGKVCDTETDVEVAMPRKVRRIFLQFAHLRI